MKKEKVPVDPLVAIEEALASAKVDPFMAHHFSFLRNEIPDLNPDEYTVPFLALVKSPDLELDGVLSRIGDVFAMLTPYSSIPSIIENSEVISLEASR